MRQVSVLGEKGANLIIQRALLSNFIRYTRFHPLKSYKEFYMAAFKYVIGAVVQLKSGGPFMTVTKDKPEAGTKFIGVSYFDGNSLKHDVLPKDAIEPDEATKKAAEKAEKEAASKKEGAPAAE
jgi:uncharacterized protein YodC (DUF2158 family)